MGRVEFWFRYTKNGLSRNVESVVRRERERWVRGREKDICVRVFIKIGVRGFLEGTG